MAFGEGVLETHGVAVGERVVEAELSCLEDLDFVAVAAGLVVHEEMALMMLSDVRGSPGLCCRLHAPTWM